jgi:hypothetical protein
MAKFPTSGSIGKLRARCRLGIRAIAVTAAIALNVMSSAPPAVAQLCATVRIEIDQELVVERQAFDARMRISNGLDTVAIENLSVAVNFRDDAGNPVLASSG